MAINIKTLKEMGDLKSKERQLESELQKGKELKLQSLLKSFLRDFEVYFTQNDFKVKKDENAKSLIANYGNGSINIEVKWNIDTKHLSNIKIMEDATNKEYEITLSNDPLLDKTKSVSTTNNDHEKLLQSVITYEMMIEKLNNVKFYFLLHQEGNETLQFDEPLALIKTLFPSK